MKPNKQPHSILKFTSLLMFGALMGKILGFVREILFARQLGASMVADSFRGATTAVLLPISPLQGDMTSGALVPLHKEWAEQGRAPQMFASLGLVLGLIAVGISLIVYLTADYYINLLVDGFSPEAKDMTIRFVHVMILALPSTALFNCFACVEISIGRIRLALIRSSIQNVSVICGILVMIWTKNPIAIAWGFAISMNISLAYGATMLCIERELAPWLITPRSCWQSIKEFFLRVRYLLTQPFFEQLSIVAEKFLASLLSVGTIASLDYARTLTDTAGYFIAQPIGLTVLRGGVVADAAASIKQICKPLFHIALPVSVFTIIFARDVVKVVFQRGAFQENAIELTSHAMQGIAVGTWAAVVGWILVRMLNASRQNKKVAKICMMGYAVNILVSFATYRFLGVFGIGLGEGSFGIFLLAGTSYALGCGKLIVRLVVEAIPITVGFAITGILIYRLNVSPLWHLAIGTGAFTTILSVYLCCVFPDLASSAFYALRRIKRRFFRNTAVT